MNRIILLLLFFHTLVNARHIITVPGENKNETEVLKNMVVVYGSYTRNLGEFGKAWENSFGVNLSYGYRKSDKLLVTINTGFGYFNSKKNLYDDASISLLPLHAGLRYTFNFGNIFPYLSFVNGVNILFTNTVLDGIKNNDILIRYHWQIGIGTIITATRKFGFDFNLNYNSSFYRSDIMMTGFEYNIGLLYKIN